MLRVVPILFALMFAASVPAAQFTTLCDSDMEKVAQGCTIKLTGNIESGDADRLVALLRRPLPTGWSYHTLLLSSPGGDVQEAFRLANIVKQTMLQTSTYRLPGGAIESWGSSPHYLNSCVSACFLVWVSGTERKAASYRLPGPGAQPVGLGLHRPTYVATAIAGKASTDVAQMHQDMTSAVRDYLRREQVPERYVEKMLEHSSREVYWLADEGDMFSMDGKAAWYEELLIARCKFDPAYDRDMQGSVVSKLASAPKGRPYNADADPAYRQYIAWRQNVNACEYQMRLEAQAKLRVGLQPKRR